MTILTKQAVLFSANGEKFRAPNGYIGQCPEWVAKTRQFKEMVADGMIVATESTSDKDVTKAAEKAKKSKRPKEAPEAEARKPTEPAEAAESTGDTATEE